MKLLSIKLLILLACLASPLTYADIVRIDKWGRGGSEFEATKDAYKQILSDALKKATGSTAQDQIMRTLIRDTEEDIRKVQSTYFPSVSAPQCDRNKLVVDCFVVAPVQMDELIGWVNRQRAVTGKEGQRISKISYALSSVSSDQKTRDFMQWLHRKLEGDYGYNVFYNGVHVDAAALEGNCDSYRDIITKRESKQQYKESVKAYKRSLNTCEEFSKRDVVIVVDSIELTTGKYQERDSSIEGFARINLSFFDNGSNRLLPSPAPKAIVQYGQGTKELAAAKLLDRLYDSSTNYIAQQFNDVVLNILPNREQQFGDSGSNYTVTISGLSSDVKEDRNKARFIRDWFKNEADLFLKRNYGGDSAEQVYDIDTNASVSIMAISDELRYALDDESLNATVDVDQNSNIVISFSSVSVSREQSITWELASSGLGGGWLRRGVEVESAKMKVSRRDQDSGVALSLHEAYIKIKNPKKNDLSLSVTPTWYDSQGIKQEIPFDDSKVLRINGKNKSGELVFRAPNRFAKSVRLSIDCENKGCKK